MIHPVRNIFLTASGLLLLSLCSCERQAAAAPVPIPVTDTEPVGDGLKVLGFAVLGSAVVCVLGRMIR
ncbi:MAG: hypothetical protein EOP88_00550 [Verrucomicrobiaceae bacterium]|nr:MAG: hypothetical protein EOP88_00550 [Verrucomicrobiaceae bacterium]